MTNRKNFCSEAEEYVLSGMINNEKMLCMGVKSLEMKDFGALDHQMVFSSLCSMYKEGITPSLEKAIIKLKSENLLQGIRVAEILGRYVPSTEDLDFYINIVLENSVFREIEKASKKIEQELDNEHRRPSDEILSLSKSFLYAINDSKQGNLGIDLRKEIDESSLDYLTSPQMSLGLSTGMKTLDEMTSGLKGGQLITLAARPGVGKTTLALNWSINLVKAHHPVYFFSIEMPYAEVKERVLSQISDINQKTIQTHSLSSTDLEKVKNALNQIDLGMLIINDKSSLKINDIVSKSMWAKDVCNISAIFIDYIQLISSDGKNEYRHLEIADMTRKLKCLAKDLGIPIICLAQFSRKVEERNSHKPILSDLKESGAIEQDSDIVLALARREIYDEFDHPGQATLSVLKNRHGPTGDIELRFDKEFSKFVEISK